MLLEAGTLRQPGLGSTAMNKRAFASLSPQEALHVAIFIEERNAELYQQFAELFGEFRDPDSLEIAQAFWDMAEEEREHGSLLQERYFERYGTQSCVITDEDIREMIELPRLDSSDILSLVHSAANTSPATKAFEVALIAEQSAQRFYAHMGTTTEDDRLRKIYRELGKFEDDHVQAIQLKIEASKRAAGELS